MQINNVYIAITFVDLQYMPRSSTSRDIGHFHIVFFTTSIFSTRFIVHGTPKNTF